MTDSQDPANAPVRMEGESLLQYAHRRAAFFNVPIAPPTEISVPKSSAPQPAEWDSDLVPEDEYDGSPFDGERQEIDAVLDRLDILDAYVKYCGKMVPDPKGKRESIMVSCPVPGHVDANPSAWVNLDKEVGFCGKCQQGFDKFDLAAWHYGYGDDYKVGINFPNLKRDMAQGLGWTVITQGKEEWLEKAQSSDPQVLQLPTDYDPLYDDPETPRLDWRTLELNPESFLHQWMIETGRQDQPEEFYLFHGLVALGVAAGNNAQLQDAHPVRANTMVCLVGKSGTQKSRSVSNLKSLLYEALPFDYGTAGGVKWLPSSGSGEDLVNQFVYGITDTTTKEVTYLPIRGIMYEDEFEGLMARVNKPNSTMRSNMMRFYDSPYPVEKSSQTHGVSSAKDHFFQAITTTQPKRLGTLMTTGDATSGFLNRWLFVFGTPKNRPVISEAQLDVKIPADLLSRVRGWTSPGRRVSLTANPVTLAGWSDFVLGELRPLEALDDALVARIELQCKKLLLLLAINDHSEVVNENHLKSLRAMFPYLKKCYGIIEDNVGITQLESCIDAMDAYFKSHPDEDITMRTLTKSSAAKKFDAATRARALETLLKLGYIAEAPKPKGTQTTKWRLVVDTGVTLASVTKIQ